MHHNYIDKPKDLKDHSNYFFPHNVLLSSLSGLEALCSNGSKTVYFKVSTAYLVVHCAFFYNRKLLLKISKVSLETNISTEEYFLHYL